MEKLLHYIWKHKILPLKALLTTDGEELEIVDTGLLNPNAGPDFFNAKVRIGQTMWAGNVEIHLKSSDWYRHGHDNDEAYDNVILHVVNVVDCPVQTVRGKWLPQLQLDIPSRLYARYEELKTVKDYPRCHKIIKDIDTFIVHSWMDILLCERFEDRTRAIESLLEQYCGDWERVLFITLARSFGFGLNGDAFEEWAKKIPIEKMGKHRDELFQIEAIFLGVAGLLGESEKVDEYGLKLRDEFAYQRRLFALPEPMLKTQWKYLRLRPQNFPHIRLAELAWMYHEGNVNLSVLLDCVYSSEPLKALYKVLDATTSDYWTTHIVLGKEVDKKRLCLTEGTKRLLVINAVVPLLYAYATTHGNDGIKERLYNIMHLMPAENNHLLRIWHECGLDVNTAADSQALIQLKRRYCDRIDCLRCRFGYEYLNAKI